MRTSNSVLNISLASHFLTIYFDFGGGERGRGGGGPEGGGSDLGVVIDVVSGRVCVKAGPGC